LVSVFRRKNPGHHNYCLAHWFIEVSLFLFYFHDYKIPGNCTGNSMNDNQDWRIASIDILRALTMLLMIFVNDLWSLKEIPG